MPSPSLASYIKRPPASQRDGDKIAFSPPIAPPPHRSPHRPPPMREISLPFPTPPYCGDFAIHIRRDGTWCYCNSPIRRQALCRLFASVLHKDADGQHWLITPAERGRISVELAPFLIVQCQYKDGELKLKTTLDEWTSVDNDHPVFMEQRTPQPSATMDQNTPLPHPPETFQEMLPYFRLNPQRRLDALMSRSVFYELAELAEYDERQNLFFVRSGEARFALAAPKQASK